MDRDSSLHASFQASMYTISKHKLCVAVSLLSVVVKIAQNDYSRLPITGTFGGNRKRFELSEVRVIEGKS